MGAVNTTGFGYLRLSGANLDGESSVTDGGGASDADYVVDTYSLDAVTVSCGRRRVNARPPDGRLSSQRVPDEKLGRGKRGQTWTAYPQITCSRSVLRPSDTVGGNTKSTSQVGSAWTCAGLHSRGCRPYLSALRVPALADSERHFSDRPHRMRGADVVAPALPSPGSNAAIRTRRCVGLAF